MNSECGYPLYWRGCYRGTYDLLNADSMAHPAKMSPALCYRILQHLQELGLLKDGDTILDPMAGTGMTNLCAGAMGYGSISVELEEKFMGFQKQNKEYAERRLYKSLDWQMIQGDSRKLSELLQRQGLKSITSPPYQDSQGHPSLGSVNKDDWGKEGKDIVKRRGLSGEYGDTEGQVGNLKSIVSPPYGSDNANLQGRTDPSAQSVLATTGMRGEPLSGDNIGNLKDTPLKAITSPPYLDSLNPPHTEELEAKRLEIAREKGISPDKVSHLDYTKKDSKLKSITSPPYEESLPNGLDRKAAEQMVQAMYDKHGRTYSKEDFEYQVELILKRSNRGYGESDGQIGKLKDKPLKSIVSPPYEDTTTKIGGNQGKGKYSGTDLSQGINRLKDDYSDYGESDGQIGKLKDKPLKSITSPPYGETGVGDWKTGRAEFQSWVINEIKTKGYVEWQGKRYNEAEWRAMNHGRIDGRTTKGVHKHPTDGYSDNPDNIGQLVDKPLKSIVSPPYGNRVDDHGVDQEGYGYKKDSYGRAEGQIGIPVWDEGRQESYLSAMFQVYSEIAKVSDVLVVVVKNPTRGGKLRRLDLDTIAILEQSGWRIHCQHRALLFEELEQADLFGGSKKQVKGRLSFFKRLSYIKGQPVANWEDILICVRGVQ